MPSSRSPPSAFGTYGMAQREVRADAAIAAGLAQEGSLASESGLRLFALAAAAKATGRLGIAPEGRAYALTFRRGTVEHAASTDPEDDLGRFLVRRGKLTEEQRARGEAARGAAGGDLAAALVAARLVSPADVAALLQEHGAGVVQRALAAESGRWSWQPDAAPPPSGFPLGAPFAMLCGAARALDVPALERRLGERRHRAASRVVGRLRIEDLKLTPQEARAAALLDGTRSPAEVAAASPGDAVTILRVALLLAEVDLLAFGPARRPAPPVAQPAAAAPAQRPAAAQRPAGPIGGSAGPRPAAAPRPSAPATSAPATSAPPTGATPAPKPPPPAARTPAPAAPGSLDRAALESLAAKLAKADRFEALGVKRDATAAQIKIAYFQLAKAYHPDAVPVDAPPEVRTLCADVFAKVSEAWRILGDETARASYLEELAQGGAADVDVMRILRAETTFQEATLLVKARRYRDALAKLDEAIAMNADEPEFAMWKGFCEFCAADDKKRKHAAAAGAIEAALARNPRCAQGYLFLGQMAKVAGDLALAERHLRRGLAVAPEHTDLQRELKYLRR